MVELKDMKNRMVTLPEGSRDLAVLLSEYGSAIGDLNAAVRELQEEERKRQEQWDELQDAARKDAERGRSYTVAELREKNKLGSGPQLYRDVERFLDWLEKEA